MVCLCSPFPLTTSGEIRCDGLFARVTVSETAFPNNFDRQSVADGSRKRFSDVPCTCPRRSRASPAKSLGRGPCPSSPCPALPCPTRSAPLRSGRRSAAARGSRLPPRWFQPRRASGGAGAAARGAPAPRSAVSRGAPSPARFQ